MNKKILIIGAVVLVAIAGVVAFVMTNNSDSNSTNNSQNSGQQTTNPTPQANNQETTEQGSLATLRDGGKARQCTFSYSGENGTGTGKMYTDGKGRGRMTISVKTEKGNTGESNTVITKEKATTWTTTNGQSTGFVFDTSTIQSNNTSTSTNSNTQNAGKNFDLKCTGWTVDEAVLTVPADVKIIELPTAQ